jgi:ribose transport system ATP-binding protein
MPEHLPLLALRSISKRFAGVRALDRVDFAVDRGEVVGLVGENGAGKSTLLRILGGVIRPDQGEILVDRERHELNSPRDAGRIGIRLIQQESVLADDLSVYENIGLGRYPCYGPRWLPIADRRRLRTTASAALERIGARIHPETIVRHLNAGRRQLVEIAKAIAAEARILIFDEPTSSLSLEEARQLLRLIERLRERGTAIVYVSHRLGEIEQIADRVVVMRDGCVVGRLGVSDITPKKMVDLMIGREIERFFPLTEPVDKNAKAVLGVEGLKAYPESAPLNFCVRRGEIVGIGGLLGSGRSKIARMLFGIDRHAGGKIRVNDVHVDIRKPTEAIRAGISLVPESRATCGLFLRLSTTFNITCVVLAKLAHRNGWRRLSEERDLASKSRESLDIRTKDLNKPPAFLSGGNQQKVLLAKWLAVEPQLLILDEPTRGVDIGAKTEIYNVITQLAARGTAIILISSEMEELIGLAHRVIVMREGAISGELSNGQVSERRIMELSVGVLDGAGAA